MIWWDYQSSFVFQAEDGIRDLVRSRGLGDVYKRQLVKRVLYEGARRRVAEETLHVRLVFREEHLGLGPCLLYTSDAADERSSVDLGGRRIIKKKNNKESNSVSSWRLYDTQITRHENKQRLPFWYKQ